MEKKRQRMGPKTPRATCQDKLEIMAKKPEEGGTGIRDPTIFLDAAKIIMLQKLIFRNRQPLLRWIKRKIISVANKLGVDKAIASNPSKTEESFK